jgi:uncharacterized membrane protein
MAVSLFLIAVGAILTWAVTATTNGLDVNTVGVILMVVGLVGFFLSLLFWSSWGGPQFFGHRQVYTDGVAPAPRAVTTRRRTTYVEEDPGAPAGPPL